MVYCGGGGSSKSGVKNAVVLASLTAGADGEPKFETVASVDAKDKLPVSVAVDADADLIAAGMHGGTVVVYGATAADELVALTEELEADKSGEDSAVECMALQAKKLVTGGDDGTICMYEKTDDKELYKNTKVFRIKVDGNTVMNARIRHMAVSPTEESLVCCLDNIQVFLFPLLNAEIMKVEDNNFEYLTQSFHTGAITGYPLACSDVHMFHMSTCARAPALPLR